MSTDVLVPTSPLHGAAVNPQPQGASLPETMGERTEH